MANMMEVTLPTIEFHRKNIRKKLNVGKLRLDQALRQYWDQNT
jgi:DNA-binding NarL/FixJ family response regulator